MAADGDAVRNPGAVRMWPPRRTTRQPLKLLESSARTRAPAAPNKTDRSGAGAASSDATRVRGHRLPCLQYKTPKTIGVADLQKRFL
jgi:hypothetical protein